MPVDSDDAPTWTWEGRTLTGRMRTTLEGLRRGELELHWIGPTRIEPTRRFREAPTPSLEALQSLTERFQALGRNFDSMGVSAQALGRATRALGKNTSFAEAYGGKVMPLRYTLWWTLMNDPFCQLD